MLEYIFIIATGLLGFFFFSLLGRSEKKLSDWIFLFWILLLLVTEVSFLSYARGQANKHPLFIATICDTHLLHPLLLYFYVRSLTDKHLKINSKSLVHFFPLIIYDIAKLYINFGLEVMECYNDGSCLNVDNKYVTALYIYKYIVMVVYIYLTLKLVKSHRKNVNSELEIYHNLWVKNLVNGTIFLFIGILLIQIFRVAFPVQFYDRMLITSTLTTFFVFILLYMANSHAFLFVKQNKQLISSKFVQKSDTTKTEKATISDEEKRIFRKVEEHVINNQSFLNGMLTLKDLADEIGCPQRQLSYCINTMTGHSFTHYINKFRVDYLKKLLNDPNKQHFTILSLAEESGFNSKSTLVRIFKQHTGMTPSMYMEQNNL